MSEKIIKAYHFTNGTLRDGRPVPEKGVWLKHEGAIEMCASGLHASVHPFDALQYAPGNTLHLVECRGEIIIHDDDKLVCRERRILKTIDAEPLLREFARKCALDVVHLWDAPEVAVKYLKTGDEALRDAASDAAYAARAADYAARAAASAALFAAATSAATFAAASAKQRRRFASMVTRAMEEAE